MGGATNLRTSFPIDLPVQEYRPEVSLDGPPVSLGWLESDFLGRLYDCPKPRL